jgi:hypothetical protein
MLLYSAVLEFACREGFKEFDFGRSSVDSGTYRFKLQWGAHPRQLYWYYWLAGGRSIPESRNPKFRPPFQFGNTFLACDQFGWSACYEVHCHEAAADSSRSAPISSGFPRVGSGVSGIALDARTEGQVLAREVFLVSSGKAALAVILKSLAASSGDVVIVHLYLFFRAVCDRQGWHGSGAL